MQTTEVRIEDGKYSVFAQITRCGRDVSLAAGGGALPHIGAVALSVPRTSLSRPDKTSASTSVVCVTGHKEDDFARRMAELVTSSLGCVTSVSAGVHIDCATPEELSRINANLNALQDAVLTALSSADA